MTLGVALLAGALSGGQAAAAPVKPALAGRQAAPVRQAAPETKQLYRLEIAGNMTLWAQDRPMQSGSMTVFHRYPDGVLVSIRRSDVLRVGVARYEPAAAARAIKPGGVIDLGITGGGSSSVAGRAGVGAPVGAAAGSHAPALGERKDGTALFNPNREYRPDWDSKEVPGLNLGYPAAPNDYQEGRTLAYPSAGATVATPGDLPRARVETGEPPKAPN